MSIKPQLFSYLFSSLQRGLLPVLLPVLAVPFLFSQVAFFNNEPADAGYNNALNSFVEPFFFFARHTFRQVIECPHRGVYEVGVTR